MTKYLWLPLPLQPWCLLLLAIGFSSLAHAQSSGYFRAAVPVASQSVRERERAAKEGLREVLVRISGTVDLEQYPAALTALGRAGTYMEQFSYETVRPAAGPAVEQLVMSFSPAAIENILQGAGLPYWPVQRPGTLIWLVEDDVTEGKRLLNDRSDPILQGLFSAAQKRGLPLLLPLLDLDDQLAIKAEQVWNLEQEAVLAASERYKADTVLIGRYSRTSGGQWWSSWQFFHRGEGRNYDLRGAEGALLGQQALTPLTDYLAGLYALRANPAGAAQLFVQVDPVGDFGTYRKILDYLQQLPVITAVELLTVTEQGMAFSFQLNGTVEQLQNALALDAKLRPESAGAPGAGGSADQPWRLQWAGR